MASVEEPAESRQYWLKTVSLSTTNNSTFGSLYLRLHGGGVDSIVLTPEPPKFLKYHRSSTTSHQPIVSTKHHDRQWGLSMGQPRRYVGWQPVEITEGTGDSGFAWELEAEGGREVLVWKSPAAEADENEANSWNGWMVTSWCLGFPQLFWLTKEVANGKDWEIAGRLPEGCEKVMIVREYCEM